MNRLTGEKVSIITPVPLTTRMRAHGIVSRPDAQVVFVDTPSIHKPRTRLGERMVEAARSAAADADVIVRAGGGSPPESDEERLVDAALSGARAPVVSFSAETKPEFAALIETVIPLLPEGPPLFDPEWYTDQHEQHLAREFVREQAMLLTREEVPHGIATEIEEFSPRESEGLTYIRVVLYVERDAHRKIVIGAGGRLLKEIGSRARREIESLLDGRVYLDLWVKVLKDWRNSAALASRLYPT